MILYKYFPLLSPQLQFNSCKFCSNFKSMPLLNFKPNLSTDQQQKVLETINQSTVDQLSKFDMTRARIKNLESWRNKKGPFKSLTDVLEVEGLGVNILKRLCTSILMKKYTESQTSIAIDDADITQGSKFKKSLLTPTLSESQLSQVQSAIGIHVTSMDISWAQIHSSGNILNNWNYFDCSNYPKKMLPHNTFNLAQKLLDKIPTSDVYIFEAGPNLTVIGQQQAISLVKYVNHLELISMLLALINTSPSHNSSMLNGDSTDLENKVFFLKSRVPARLFQTLIGMERVSTCTTISNIFKHSKSNNILPCTPVCVNPVLKQQYEATSSLHKDFLGQALILVIAFMDLCVYRNPITLKSFLGPKNNKLIS